MVETYIGHIKTPQDALIIFEACRRGILHTVKRRLSTKERMKNIQSGSIFAFDEGEAGMRRWTDGRTWSPSRVLGSFLTYRELDTKRRPRRHSNGGDLDGTGICSYKPNGLIKQSFSICTASNQKLHLISYYTKADAVNDQLTLPSLDPNLNKIVIPKGMYPELNPLDTSGGHSATLHLMMKNYTGEHQQCPISNKAASPNSKSNGTYESCNHTNKLYSKKELTHGHLPSLSSSPLSTCSDDDLMSPSHISLSLASHYHQHHHHHHHNPLPPPPPPPTLTTTTTILRQTLSPLTEPVFITTTNIAQPSCLSPPVQVWKPYSLQSEDSRQLEALKSQLRI